MCAISLAFTLGIEPTLKDFHSTLTTRCTLSSFGFISVETHLALWSANSAGIRKTAMFRDTSAVDFDLVLKGCVGLTLSRLIGLGTLSRLSKARHCEHLALAKAIFPSSRFPCCGTPTARLFKRRAAHVSRQSVLEEDHCIRDR